MFIDRGADGELSHLQGHQDDAFNVTNKDFSSNIQGSACASFDNVTCIVACGCFHRDDLVRVGAHGGGQVLQGESPTVNEPVCVNTGKEASEILVVDSRCREVVEVGVLEELDEVENVTFCEVVREGLWK